MGDGKDADGAPIPLMLTELPGIPFPPNNRHNA